MMKMKFLHTFLLCFISAQLFAQINHNLLIAKWQVDAELTYAGLSDEVKRTMKQSTPKMNLKDIMDGLEQHIKRDSFDPIKKFKEELSNIFLEFKEDKSLVVYERTEQNIGSWGIVKDKNALSLTTDGIAKEFLVSELTADSLILEVDDGGVVFKMFLKKF
jgi:hypothetical protein